MSLVPGFTIGAEIPQKSSNMLSGIRTAVILNDVDEVLKTAEFLYSIGGIEVVRVLNSILCEVGVQNEASYALRSWITSLQRDPMPEMQLQFPVPAASTIPIPQRSPSPRLQQAQAQLADLNQQNARLEAELKAAGERQARLERELGTLARITPDELQELRDHVQVMHQQMGHLRTLHTQQFVQRADEHAKELETLRAEHARHFSEASSTPVVLPRYSTGILAQQQVQSDTKERLDIVAQLGIRPEQAQIVFNFFDMLNATLARAEQTRKSQALRELYAGLRIGTVATILRFKDCIKNILGLEGGAAITQENIIDELLASVLNTRPQSDTNNQVITGLIGTIIIRQPQYLQDAKTLVALLAKLQAGMPQAGLTTTTWDELQPIHKLYY